MTEGIPLCLLIEDNQEVMRRWRTPYTETGYEASYQVLKSLLESLATAPRIPETLYPASPLPIFELIAHLSKNQSHGVLKVTESFTAALMSPDTDIEYYSALVCYHRYKYAINTCPVWLQLLAEKKLRESFSMFDSAEWKPVDFLYGLFLSNVEEINRTLEAPAFRFILEEKEDLIVTSALRYIYRFSILHPLAFLRRADFKRAVETLAQSRCFYEKENLKKLLKLGTKCEELSSEVLAAFADQMRSIKVNLKPEDELNLFGKNDKSAQVYATHLLIIEEMRHSLQFTIAYNSAKNPLSFERISSDYYRAIEKPESLNQYPYEIVDFVRAQVYSKHSNDYFLQSFFELACVQLLDFDLAKEILTLFIINTYHNNPIAESELVLVERYVGNLLKSIQKTDKQRSLKTYKMQGLLELICKLLPQLITRMQGIISQNLAPDLLYSQELFLESISSPVRLDPVPEVLIQAIDIYASCFSAEVDVQSRIIDFSAFAETHADDRFHYDLISIEDSKNPDIYAKEFIDLIRYEAFPKLQIEIKTDHIKRQFYQDFLQVLTTSVVLKLLYGDIGFQAKQWIVSFLSNIFSYKVQTTDLCTFTNELYQGTAALACSDFPQLDYHEIAELEPFIKSSCFKKTLFLVIGETVPDAVLLGHLKEVYYANLPANISGVTVFGGSILLNSSMRSRDKVSRGKRIVTILHELAHKARKMSDGFYKILKKTSPGGGKFSVEVPSTMETQVRSEGGLSLEDYLFGCFLSKVNEFQLEFITTASNWEQSLEQFRGMMEKLGNLSDSVVYSLSRGNRGVYDLQRTEPRNSLHY